MTTKDTLTLLREVEAALGRLDKNSRHQKDPEYTSERSYGNYDDCFDDGCEQANYEAAAIARDALPIVQELIRRASVGVDEESERVARELIHCASKWQEEVCLVGNATAADIYALCNAFLNRPHLAPVASVDAKVSEQPVETTINTMAFRAALSDSHFTYSVSEDELWEFLGNYLESDLPKRESGSDNQQPPQAKGAGE